MQVHGWTLLAHPLFLAQVEQLTAVVEKLKRKNPKTYASQVPTKHLAAIHKLAFDLIPQDPARPEYRLGMTLGAEHKHWFRAKFFQQYRLFFRYHTQSRIIVYAWVNDDESKRGYEHANDVYEVFRKMLKRGKPPNDWEQLLKESAKL